MAKIGRLLLSLDPTWRRFLIRLRMMDLFVKLVLWFCLLDSREFFILSLVQFGLGLNWGFGS